MHVQHVRVDSIQKERVVKPVQQSLDVRHVHKQLKHVRSVQMDIICQVDHV